MVGRSRTGTVRERGAGLMREVRGQERESPRRASEELLLGASQHPGK